MLLDQKVKYGSIKIKQFMLICIDFYVYFSFEKSNR